MGRPTVKAHGAGAARQPLAALTADLAHLDPIWDHRVPAEQQRIAQLLLDQVAVYPDRFEIALRADDLYSLVAELHSEEEDATAN